MAKDKDTDAPGARRRRTAAESAKPAATDGTGDRQFIASLARGLEILAAFRPEDRQLGNQELAQRTGIPKPTVSRLTFTLTELGYLVYSPRFNTYEIGGKMLALGHAAFASVDIRQVARDHMAAIAEKTNLDVGLGMRDGLTMLHIEACESAALVGLRGQPGSRVPSVTTALGRAYLSAAPEDERQEIFEAVRKNHGDEWPDILRAIDRAAEDIARQGFCLSVGDWKKDINGAAGVIAMPDGRGIYCLNVGAPAYQVSQDELQNRVGPMMAEAIRSIRERLGCEG